MSFTHPLGDPLLIKVTALILNEKSGEAFYLLEAHPWARQAVPCDTNTTHVYRQESTRMQVMKGSIRNTFTGCLFAVGASMSLSATADNILVNGSFEGNDVAANSWQVFASEAVDGWGGGNIEIWDNYNGVNAADGSQFVELNSHPAQNGAFTLFQDFATVVGQAYTVTFAYRARSNADESFFFEVGNLGQALVADHVTGAWTNYTTSFIADAITSRIAFTTLDGTTLGNFIDDVNVTAVPTPATLGLLGLGLMGLRVAGRRGTRHD